jgi:general stress protein 26
MRLFHTYAQRIFFSLSVLEMQPNMCKTEREQKARYMMTNDCLDLHIWCMSLLSSDRQQYLESGPNIQERFKM